MAPMPQQYDIASSKEYMDVDMWKYPVEVFSNWASVTGAVKNRDA